MKKQDLFLLSNGLHACGNLKGVKFAYAIAKNINIVNKEIELMQISIGPSEKAQEYEKKRIELATKHAKKDESGQPIVKEGRYIIEDQAIFDKAIEELRIEYKDALDEHEKKNKEYQEMLQEESDIVLFKINQNIIPEDITVDQMKGISEIIND